MGLLLHRVPINTSKQKTYKSKTGVLKGETMINDDQLKEEINKIEKDFHQALAELIAIPSVLEEGVKGMPFGKPIDLALKKALEITEKLGFKTYKDPDGYYGYAETGNGEDMIGVLGHIDVVPVGNRGLWETSPFEAMIKDGKMFGRGTIDDKGPMLAALFATRALVNLGMSFSKRVRFIFGTDEENLWRCMDCYCQKEELPTMGFTPDSTFPLVYAEKGLLQVILEGPNETELRINAGGAINAVPDQASYSGKKQTELKTALDVRGFSYVSHDDHLVVLGSAAHAMLAEEGINAINRLLIGLKDIGYSSKVIEFVCALVKEDPYAEGIFGVLEDEMSGKLKFNIGKLDMTAQQEKIIIDMRIPVTVEVKTIATKLKKAAKAYGLTYSEYDFLKSIYVPKDSNLIKTLMTAYQDVTGDMVSEPISSGGATYARAMDNFVAFGASFPGQVETQHQPNEHIVLDQMRTAMMVYAKALCALASST